MRDWRCHKTINMDEQLYHHINANVPNGLQSKALGAIIEAWFQQFTAEELPEAISRILVYSHANITEENRDGRFGDFT